MSKDEMQSIHEQLRDAIHAHVRECPERTPELQRDLEQLSHEAAAYRYRLETGQACQGAGKVCQ